MHTIVSLCHIQRWSSENHSDRISTMSQKIPDEIYFLFISILYPLHMIESIKTFVFYMKMMGRVCKNYSAVSVWRGSMPHKALSSIDNKMTTYHVNTTVVECVKQWINWWVDESMIPVVRVVTVAVNREKIIVELFMEELEFWAQK